MAGGSERMTLQEVARRAKVSTATVSRVLNNTGRVKEAARARVLKAIDELNYHPNIHARTLARGRSRTLGLIVSNLKNPFFLDIFQALEADAHEKGFEVVVANTDYRPEQLLTQARLMQGRRVAGLAVIVSEMEPTLIEGLLESRIPVVFYDVGVAARHCANIRTDYARGTRRVVEYLHSLGHRRLAFVGHHTALAPLHVRRARLRSTRCGTAAGTPPARRWWPTKTAPPEACTATRQLLASGFAPTAIVCVNDFMALGVTQGAPRDGARRSPGRLGGGLRQHQPVRVRVPGADHDQHPPGEDRAPGRRGVDARRRGVASLGSGDGDRAGADHQGLDRPPTERAPLDGRRPSPPERQSHMPLHRSALLLFLVLPPSPAAARDYFVSATGDDDRSGSAAEPWRTLAKVNATSLQPGDRVLLEGGRTFVGPLELGSDDRGTPARNIVVTSYGVGRAVIDGGDGRAVTVDGCDHVLLQRLKLVGAGRKTGNVSDGLYLAHSTGSTVDDVEVTGFRHSGVEISGTQDARVTNVHAHQNGFAGIHSGGDRRRTCTSATA